jgi:hypothetical protein
MTRRKSKGVSFDAMVKFFMKTYEIPTRKDVEQLNTRLDRIEKLLRRAAFAPGVRSVATTGKSGRIKAVLTATDIVLEVIRNNKEGLGFKEIQAATGFEDKKIRNIIYRLDKIGKIERKGRGIYVPVE